MDYGWLGIAMFAGALVLLSFWFSRCLFSWRSSNSFCPNWYGGRRI